MQQEFKMHRIIIVFNVFVFSTVILIFLIGIILKIRQGNLDYLILSLLLLSMSVSALGLYNTLFKRVRVVCAQDAFIVYRGKKQIVRIDDYSAEFWYDIYRAGRGRVRCVLIIGKFGEMTNRVFLEEIGLHQFKEICEILHMKNKLNLERSKSELKKFQIK